MAILGQKFILEVGAPFVSPATAPTYVAVGGMNSFELSRERDTTDVNTFDNPDWREVIPTMKEWSISGDLYYAHADAGQRLLADAFASDEAYYFRLTRQDGLVGAYEFSGRGFVTNQTLEGEMNDPVSTPIEIIGTGTLTEAQITA